MTTQTNNDRAVIQLDPPIVRGQTEIKEVELRRPLAGALRGISVFELIRMHSDALFALLPRITEPPLLPHELNAMDPADFVQCGLCVSAWLTPKSMQVADQVTEDA